MGKNFADKALDSLSQDIPDQTQAGLPGQVPSGRFPPIDGMLDHSDIFLICCEQQLQIEGKSHLAKTVRPFLIESGRNQFEAALGILDRHTITIADAAMEKPRRDLSNGISPN